MADVYYSYKPKELAHEMLFFVLEKYYGITADENSLSFNENGKPYLISGELFFNITHTKGLIMVAVSKREVGIDAENFAEKKVDFDGIAKKYFSEAEREQIKSERHFFTLWTKKESAIKYAGKTLAKNLKITTFKGETPTGDPAYEGANTKSYLLSDHVYSITSKDPEHKVVFLI